MDPFILVLNIVSAVILIVYIVFSIIKKQKQKKIASETKSEKCI